MKVKTLLFTLSLVLLSISPSCVYANNGRGNEHSFIQNYKVSPNLDLSVSTMGSNIRISDSSTDFNATTSGGNILLDNIDGKLNVSTSGGNIQAGNIANGLTAKTSGGSIKLLKVHQYIDVSTSGGSISLNEVSGSIKATTSGGNIKANIIELTDRVELKTSGGSINALLPSGIGLDLDLSADKIDTPLLNFTGSAKKNRIVGQLNGGGVEISLSTSAGTIVLDYK